MDLSDLQLREFGVALNEATLVGVGVAPDERRAWVTLAVLSLPERNDPPAADPGSSWTSRG